MYETASILVIQMKSHAFAGSALIAHGVATSSLLAPQSASALDFTFSFGGVGGVQGIIEGLVTGANLCDSSQPACVVKVTNSGGTGAPAGPYIKVTSPARPGFTVSAGGQIASADWIGTVTGINAPGEQLLSLFLGPNPCGGPTPICQVGFVGGGDLGNSGDPQAGYFKEGTDLKFDAVKPPASSVPGPLPLFGAAAAFGYSRKLRKRIKSIRTSASTRPAI
jgi:hypothetical protein